MTREDIDTYNKVLRGAAIRGRKIFDSLICTNTNTQEYNGIEIEHDSISIRWSECCCGEWTDYNETFPIDLIIFDTEDEFNKKLNESYSERIQRVLVARRASRIRWLEKRKNRVKNEQDRLNGEMNVIENELSSLASLKLDNNQESDII